MRKLKRRTLPNLSEIPEVTEVVDSRKRIKRISKRLNNEPVLFKDKVRLSKHFSALRAEARRNSRKLKVQYVKQECAFVDEHGVKCTNPATGKSSLCVHHGGNPVVVENLLRGDEELFLSDLSSKFDPAFHPLRYIEFASDGLSEVEIAAEFRVSLETLRLWQEKFESMYTAANIGKCFHETWWINTAKENLTNRNFNTPLFKFMAMNKLGYAEKVAQKSTNMNLHGVLMVPDPVSEEEWENESIAV